MRNYDDDIDAWWWYRMMHRGPGWVARGAVTCPLRWCTRQNWCSLHFYTFISWILHPTLYNLELTLQPRVYCNQDGSMYSTWCTAFQLIHCKGSCILCTWLHCSRTCNCDIGQLGISRLWEEGGGGTDKLREKKLTHSLHCASLLPPHPTALINVQRKIDDTLRMQRSFACPEVQLFFYKKGEKKGRCHKSSPAGERKCLNAPDFTSLTKVIYDMWQGR